MGEGADKPLIDQILEVVNERVKLDDPLVQLITYVYFSRFTDNPLNLFLRGESSIGKTYVTRSTIEALGEDEDVWWLGGLSPASLAHEHGQLYYQNTPLDQSLMPSKAKIKAEHPDWDRLQVQREYEEQMRAWNEKLRESYFLVDLTGKLLIFLESPSLETFDRLRPLLSHDKHEISFKFVDKTGKGQLRTVHVKLRGWPATIFMSTKEKYVADLSTRSLTATPNLSEEKIRKALDVTAKKYAYPPVSLAKKELHDKVEWVKARLKVGMGKLDVLIPYAELLPKYVQLYLHRVMRDFDHFLQTVKMNALVNLQMHDVAVETENCKYILATLDDMYSALNAWRSVEETTLTGASGSALRVFDSLIKPSGPVTNYHMLVEKSRLIFQRPLSSATLRKYVNVLADIGLVDVEPDPEDKRRKVIRVIGEKQKMLKNEIHEFKAFFKPENLKAWWNGLKKLCAKTPVLYIPQIFPLEPQRMESLTEDEKLNIAYEKMCIISERVFLHTFFKTQNGEKNENEAK